MGPEEFALNVIINLLSGAIQAGVSYAAVPYFTRRKIERRVEDATAEVVEPMLPFLSQEGIPEDKQRRLIQTCVDELRPLSEKPELLFQGSLDGQKIFEMLYKDRDLPQTVVEDGLRDAYVLLFPRIATLLCKIPAAVKDWESEAWAESYRRLDEITGELRALFIKIDSLTAQPAKEADETFLTVRRTLTQKVGLEMELTGLRADKPVAAKFDDLFIHPIISIPVTREEAVVRSKDESFGEFTSANTRIILVAPPGAGKSTWEKWLQREVLIQQKPRIAVRVELRQLAGGELPTIYELIRDVAGRHLAEELTPGLLSRWLKKDQVVFILDGFDEVRVGDRDKVQTWVVEMQDAARGCPFIITSRPLTTDHLDGFGSGWLQWTIQPFDQPRIIDYIQRWHRYVPLLKEGARDIDAVALSNDWISDPTIEPLTGNPLLLSTLLMVHHLDGRLPSGRAQLYRRYVEGMLGVWDDRRKVEATSIQLSLEQKRQILRGLALQMFIQEQDQIDEPVTIDIVDRLLKDLDVGDPAETVLALLRERTGLLVGPGSYSFVHKSVAEYLVAEAIVQGDQRDARGDRIDRFKLFEHRGDDRWNTVTFLWGGLAPVVDAEAFIDACVEADHQRLAYGLLLDQYERIAKPKRFTLLKALLFKNVDVREDEFSGNWIFSHPYPDYSELLALGFDIRGLSPFSNIEALLARAYQDGTLTWEDAEGYEGLIRDILWMRVVTEYKSLEDLSGALNSKWPEITAGDPKCWLAWIIERTILSKIHGENVFALEDTVGRIVSRRPDALYILPLLIISSFVVADDPQGSYDDNRQAHPEGVAESLSMLISIDYKSIDHAWLKGTSNWKFGWFLNSKPRDLLTKGMDQLKKYNRLGVLDSELTRSASLYLENIKKLREGFQEDSA